MNNSPILNTTVSRVMKITPKIYTGTAEMMFAYNHGLHQEGNDLAFENMRMVAKLFTLYSLIPTYTGSPSAKIQVEQILQEEVPVEMGFTEQGWFVLRIPRLLPRKERGKGSAEHIRSYLYPAMKRFFQNEHPIRFDDCVLIYRHIYSRDEPERRYRDHDNIETNFVTDTIALFVMTDDAPMKCMHFHCSAAGSQERTEVYVVPEPDFIQWYEMSKTFPDEGIPLYKQTTFYEEKQVPKQD